MANCPALAVTIKSAVFGAEDRGETESAITQITGKAESAATIKVMALDRIVVIFIM
jgi:hypothetical protein